MKQSLRVLIQPRPTAQSRGGGDYLQLVRSLEPLPALGVEAQVSTDLYADLSRYDLVEIFSAVEPDSALGYYLNARRQRKPVVVMPIYWTLDRLWKAQLSQNGKPADARAAQIVGLEHAIYRQRARIVLRGADWLMPNSVDEGERLVSDYGVVREKLRVVYDGVQPLFANGDAERFAQQFGVRDFILCVAEITPRKNQLNLLRALEHDARPLVFMGQPIQADYYDECRRLAERRGQVTFIAKQPVETVADAYAAARIHVLVSLYDIAPLVTLEAASAGLPQVITTECGMRDYFRGDAEYCDPDDLVDIRRAVESAWQQPRAPAIAARLLGEFSWERTARERLAVYQAAVAQGPTALDQSDELYQLAIAHEAPLRILWQWLEEQARTARAVEAWAHQLEAQLKAPRGLRAQLGRWITPPLGTPRDQ